jgi:hypothetical protein
MGDAVQEREFDPYGEMDDGEAVQCYVCTEGG